MAPTKRTVDADDESKEMSDPKRPRISLDERKKKKVLEYVMRATSQVYLLFSLQAQLQNITIGHQIASILQGGHNILRRIANTRVAAHRALLLTATVTTAGVVYTKTYKEVTDVMKLAAAEKGLEYTLSDRRTNDHWYGIANPIFNIISAFKLRYDEIRLGVGKMPVSKTGDVTSSVDVSQYGITPAHHVLLEGSTYKPERRSAMAQTLGPLTALIVAYRSKEPYRQKWVEAVKRDMAHVPHVMDLTNAMQGRRAEEVAPAVGALADCLLIAGTRNAQRAFFPLNMLFTCFIQDSDIDAFKLTLPKGAPDISEIDFSGKGMWLWLVGMTA